MHRDVPPMIEHRPDLAGWIAVVCEGCGSYTRLRVGSASCARPCRCNANRSIHDLERPCTICVHASDDLAAKFATEGRACCDVCGAPGVVGPDSPEHLKAGPGEGFTWLHFISGDGLACETCIAAMFQEARKKPA